MGPSETSLVHHYDSTRRRLYGGSPQIPHQKNNDSLRIDDLSLRIEILEKQVASLLAKPKTEPGLTVEFIILFVSQHEQIRRNLITGGRRCAALCMARHYICYLASTLTGRSLGQIAQKLGDRDHTTVLHGFRKLHALRPQDVHLDARLSFYEEMLCPGLK